MDILISLLQTEGAHEYINLMLFLTISIVNIYAFQIGGAFISNYLS